MKTLTIKPRNKKELSTFIKVLKALNADFEIIEDDMLYDTESVNSILKTKNQKSFKIDPHNVWQSIQ